MNYGKTAYLKVLDIEKELKNINNKDSGISYYEFNKPNINENFNKQNPFSLNLDNSTKLLYTYIHPSSR